MYIELPKVNIRWKNDLAKRLSSNWDYKKTLKSINDVLNNYSKYYHNHKYSVPEENKFVRASKWALKNLNKLINERLLKGIDKYIPYFIFWWISGRNHIKAVKEHKTKENRTYIKLDLRRYFDQIDIERVIGNLVNKLWCSKKWASIIALLCCVPEWEFYNEENKRLLARWFNTSSRLSVLCSLEFFQKINWLLQKKYSNLNPKVSVYVDDITISIDNTTDKDIDDIITKIYSWSEKYNLLLNKDKEDIIKDTNIIEILWIKLKRWKMSLWNKSLLKRKEAYKKWTMWDKTAINSIIWYKNYSKTLFKT